jgi:hypothetical protein
MNAVELIGFFVTVAMILFYVAKWLSDAVHRQRDPEGFARREREREARLRKLLGQLDPDVVGQQEEEREGFHPVKIELPRRDKKKGEAAPQREVQRSKEYKPPVVTHSAESYEVVVRKTKPSRGAALLMRQRSQKDLLVMKEIFDKPLSMR